MDSKKSTQKPEEIACSMSTDNDAKNKIKTKQKEAVGGAGERVAVVDTRMKSSNSVVIRQSAQSESLVPTLPSPEVWITPSSRRRKADRKAERRPKQPPLVGTGQDSKLSAVPRKAFLFVKRLSPGTEACDVVSLLRPVLPEVTCEVVSTAYSGPYRPFKVTIDLVNLEKALKADIWPAGALVTRFFHQRRRPPQPPQ